MLEIFRQKEEDYENALINLQVKLRDAEEENQ